MSALKKKNVSLVIPVYNEQEAIANVIENIKQNKPRVISGSNDLDTIEIVLVDDGSYDQSLRIMKQAIGQDPDFKIISHDRNKGYGAALQTGFEAATYSNLAFYDGDDTFKFENITPLLDAYFSSDADIITGCRFTDESKMPLIRRIGNKFFCFVLFVLTYERVKDTSSGIRIFYKKILRDHLYPLPMGLNFIIVMTTKIIFENLSYKEVPVPYDERIGESKLNVLSDGVLFIKSLISVVSLNNPFKMYFLGTVLAGILAVFFGSIPLKHYLEAGTVVDDDVNWMIISTFFLNVGFVTYSIGLISAFINTLIFALPGRKSILSKYLSSPFIYSNFGIFSKILLLISFVVFLSQKLGAIESSWVTLLTIATCGLNGLILASLDYLIKHIEKQTTHAKDKAKYRQALQEITIEKAI